MKPGKRKTRTAPSPKVTHRNRIRILELRGKIIFDPIWDYKQMRRKSR